VDDWTYGYDNLDHLLSATNTNTASLNQTFTYYPGGKLPANLAVGSYAYPTQGRRLCSRMQCKRRQLALTIRA